LNQEDEKSGSSWLEILYKFVKMIAGIPFNFGWIAGIYLLRWMLRFFILVVSFRLMGFEHSLIYFAALLVLTEIIIWDVSSKTRVCFAFQLGLQNSLGFRL